MTNSQKLKSIEQEEIDVTQFNVTEWSDGRQVRGCTPGEGRHTSESNVYFANVSGDDSFGR